MHARWEHAQTRTDTLKGVDISPLAEAGGGAAEGGGRPRLSESDRGKFLLSNCLALRSEGDTTGELDFIVIVAQS